MQALMTAGLVYLGAQTLFCLACIGAYAKVVLEGHHEWGCEFCHATFDDRSLARVHRASCRFNPDFQHAVHSGKVMLL